MIPVLLSRLARLLPIALLALAFQRMVFADAPVFDAKVQFVLALAVAAGAAGGADTGAVAGFMLGMLFDLAGDTPVGVHALAYGIGGLTAGYVKTITPDPQWWLAALFAALGAAVGEVSAPIIEVITGQRPWVTARFLAPLPVVAITAGLMCPVLVYPGRWMMGVKKPKWRVIPE